jgi:bifunctional oligoribonuclease and PAP phosphatase NrnA
MAELDQSTDYVSTATYAQVAERIRRARRIAVLSHSKPDGDAIGSMLAIKRAIEAMHNRAEHDRVDIFLMGAIEPNLLIIVGQTPYFHIEETQPSDDYDLILVVDTGAWSQLEPSEQWLRRHHDSTIVLDHHAWGDSDVASMRIVDPSMASATQLLVPLLDELGCPLTGGIGGVAEALFVGLATDTGWFRHNNAGTDVFALAARLLAHGVDKSRLYQILEETHRPQRLALEARALSSLTYALNDTVAIMSLTMQDFQTTNGSLEDLTGLVNMPMIVGRIRIAILLAQIEPGLTKISFRSKPPIPGYEEDGFYDVNKLAQQFGGGGHAHAAGARIESEIEDARAAVIQAVELLARSDSAGQ